MGRRKEEHYWNQVTKEADGTWKCKRCGRKFSGGASRIKAHVDRIPGKGISPCSASPTHDHNHPQPQPQQQQTANPMEVAAEDRDHEMVDASVFGNIISEPINLPGGSAEVAQSSNNNDFKSNFIKMLNELLNYLTLEENDIKGELEWIKSQGKQSKTQVDDWLNELQQLKMKIGDWLNLVMGPAFGPSNYRYHKLQQLDAQLSEHTKRKPVVLSNEIVGEDFERNVKSTRKFVGDNQVFMIGIHGMGGVGKTCLATHMESQIKRKGTFNHIIWVTVSPDYTISHLQEEIAEAIGVKLGGNERTRAAHLSSALLEKGKWVLILDDVWKFIDLEKVGIPRCRINGSKLILTSRLRHVLRQMDCPTLNIITMYPLSRSEGLELFLVRLGEDHKTPATFPPNILNIAESVAWECDGLPLAISVMARTMKGICNIHQWRHALNKLDRQEMRGEIEEEVFQVLKLSYDNLRDRCLQNSFLHCALYSHIEARDKMIMKLVDSGAINGRRSLEEILDEGHTIFNELQDHSLLLPRSETRVNNSLRDMACLILKESKRCLVRCDQRLTEIPHMQEWIADLDLISLDTNEIEEIPEGISSNCPRLSTLILSNNHISSIPESFFRHMKSLTILDLSNCGYLKSLPESLSDLSCLVSLLLDGCKALANVPPLGRLQKLSRLVISGTQVEVVQGLEMLTNLTWLDLSYNSKLMLELGRMLRGLTNLQYLDLFKATLLLLEIEDVQGLTKLEYFVVGFHGRQSYNNFVASTWNGGSAPKSYLLYLASINDFRSNRWISETYKGIAPTRDNYRILNFGDLEESIHLLPKGLTNLRIDRNVHWKSLCDALSNNGSSSLKRIDIKRCTQMKSVFCSFGNCSFCSNLNNLQCLYLECLERLTVICKEDVAVTHTTTQPLNPNAVFSHLKHFEISGCDGIETLVTAGLLPQLRNLQTLTVLACKSLREIFAASSSGADSDDAASTITLPNLTSLWLSSLPMLETVCKGIIISASMPKMNRDYCPKLESRSPFQVSSSS